MEKKRAIVITAVFALLVFGFALWHILLPDGEISVFERRKLEQKPQLSSESIFDGSFSKDLEDYLLDQFPLRQKFVALNTSMRYYAFGQTRQDDMYLQDGSAFEAKPMNETGIKAAANRIEAIAQQHLQNSKVYYSVIPNKNAFMEDQGQPKTDYGFIYKTLGEKLPNATAVEISSLLSAEDYYKTDLHWKQECIYPVAEKLAEAMGADLVPFEKYTQNSLSPFYGSFYSRSPKPLKAETLTYLTSSMTQRAFVTGSEFNGRRPVYVPDYISGVDGYDVFLHGAQAFLTVEIPNVQEKRELIIFRDSFGSSIAPYFLGAYSKITLVDLRYMNSMLLEQYVDFEGADVLFLYSAGVLNNGTILK